MPFGDWWHEGEKHVWEFVEPASGKVLGSVRKAPGHVNAWVFTWRAGRVGICKGRDEAMRNVEDHAALIGRIESG